jgi:hypothetical protein
MMILQWVFAVVGILGIISNLFVLVVVLRAKKFRQKPRNWFIFHQSVADLISAVSMVLISTRNTDLLTLSDVSKVLNVCILCKISLQTGSLNCCQSLILSVQSSTSHVFGMGLIFLQFAQYLKQLLFCETNCIALN